MVDAGKNLTTLVAGGCFVHHADAFLMIRGGISMSACSAHSSVRKGDLANWTTKTRPSRPGSAAHGSRGSAPGRSDHHGSPQQEG